MKKKTNRQGLIQLLKVKKSSKEIDEKIEKLKKKLRRVRQDYYEKVYELLIDILQLRQEQIKNYKISDLAHEKGIGMTSHQVLYVFGYQHLSQKTSQLINSGKLKLSTALFIIKQSQIFREEKFQDKIISQFMKGNLTTTEISRTPIEMLLDRIDEKTKMSLGKEFVFNVSFKIQELRKQIQAKKNLIKDEWTLNQLKKPIEKLYDDVDKIDLK